MEGNGSTRGANLVALPRCLDAHVNKDADSDGAYAGSHVSAVFAITLINISM
jgi:hypothetical protein